MTEIRFEIPEELGFIKQIPNIDWSILFNKFIRFRLEEIARLKRGLSKSKLTEEDVEEFSNRINEALSKKYLE